jgi:hypothetical protein
LPITAIIFSLSGSPQQYVAHDQRGDDQADADPEGPAERVAIGHRREAVLVELGENSVPMVATPMHVPSWLMVLNRPEPAPAPDGRGRRR